MNQAVLVAAVVVTTVTVAGIDFGTSADLIGSILFTVPLALCALQPSMRLLWGTAVAAGLLTIAAQFWGFERGAGVEWTGVANRGLLVASLLTLTAFIHSWKRKVQQEAPAQRHLARMEVGQRTSTEALRESEERYRLLLDGVRDYAIFMMDPQGQIISWNAGAERIKGYRADEIVGRSFDCFFTPEDIEHSRPQQVLALAAANGRHEEQGIRVRKDGSRFLARVVFTALLDTAGNLRGFSEFSHDLSEGAASEAKYRGLLEAAPDAMVVVNENGDIVLVNLQAEKQFGYRSDELLGKPVLAIIPDGFATRLLADRLRTAAEALAQEIGSGVELTGRRKDGTEFPIEVMLSPLRNSEGVLVTAAIRDVTVRNAAQKHLVEITRDLSQKHRLLDSVFEGTTDPIYVRDLEDRFMLANTACARLFSLSVHELVGMNMRELLSDDRHRVVAESDGEIARTNATRTVEEVVEIEGHTRIFLTTKGPYRDGDQKTIGTIGIARDITERRAQEQARLEELQRDIAARKLSEEHLAQMESRYRGLLEAAPDAMVIADVHGRIVLINAETERLFGYPRIELVGQPVEMLVPERAREMHPQHRRAYFRQPRTRSMGVGLELHGRRKDGSEFPVEIMLSPSLSEEGTLVTAAVRDITERKRAEGNLVKTMQELKRSNDELEQFAYIASHDLQEPLRMVASYTQLLAKRYTGQLDADADEFIAYAVDGSSRMQALIQDLLAYSRAGTGGKVPREISSENALSQALANLEAAIEESGAVVTHDALPAITTDDTQLTQVFQNLVGNAIKYRGAAAPQVHVSATRGRKEWTFAVRDNGLGIESQYFARIFVLFQRLHGRREFKGTGIGLAICKKTVERHGGRMWVESEPGRGSTFFFTIPAGEGSPP
jgi:PAS domain S-box-containing protein